MEFINPKFKYIFASILLLGGFLCGYNFKQWYVTNHRNEKHISLIYSCSKKEADRGQFEELLKKEFRSKGVEPIFDKFYLDCNHFGQAVEMEHIGNYLGVLKSKPIDLIIVMGDQATHSLLSTRHPLLYFVPVVACNVHFPDEDLLKKYESRKVYALRRKLGVVFQDFKLLPKLTVYENVAFAMEVLGYDKKEIHKRVMDVLDLVGLKNKVRQFPDQLSGGEQQRVVIARAIVNKPKLLICDEPTGNLDPDTSLEIMKVLDEINAMGTTIIMATHDRDIVDKMKKRVIVLDRGRLAKDIEKGSYCNEKF